MTVSGGAGPNNSSETAGAVRAQTYTAGLAVTRMRADLCPECGRLADQHNSSVNFWEHFGCTLRPSGVAERIGWQRYLDETAAEIVRGAS